MIGKSRRQARQHPGIIIKRSEAEGFWLIRRSRKCYNLRFGKLGMGRSAATLCVYLEYLGVTTKDIELIKLTPNVSG